MLDVAAQLAAARVADDGELWLGGERLSVGRLRLRIAQVFAGEGLEQPEGNILAPAEEGSVPHNSGSSHRTLRAGESLVVDLFPRGLLFADCTRTFCVGEVPAALEEAHAAVAAALAEAHAAARPGVRCWQLQERACATLAARGYPTPISEPGNVRGYVHGLGHGVGFELHEYPSFREQADDRVGRLAVGDLFTLEPGLYDAEASYGVRLEDLCHLGADGLENLTPLPYELDPRAWAV